MSGNENKKTPEELADEALDKVAGGETLHVGGICPGCQEDKALGLYYDPASPNRLESIVRMCSGCARDRGYVSLM